MKKSLLLLAALMTGAVAFAQEASVTTPTADTWLRLNNKVSHATGETMEIKSTFTTDETTGEKTYTADHVGVLVFDMPATPEGYTIEKATLRLTTERIKSNRNISLYAFTGDIAEDAVYADYADQITAARQTTAVGTMSLEGQNQKSVAGDDITTAKYQTITAWQNTADITAYVQTVTAKSFGILIAANASASAENRIFTKEASAINNTKCTYFTDVTAADLTPQLTITYAKGSAIKGIGTVKTVKSTATYNMAGQKVANDYKGIVVVDGKKYVK